MRILSLALIAVALVSATLIPGPNLTKRIESAEAIVVAKLVGGTTLASGSQVSNNFVLHIDRVLKGSLIPGSEVAAHLEGRGMFMSPAAHQTAIAEKLNGIWFLKSHIRRLQRDRTR